MNRSMHESSRRMRLNHRIIVTGVGGRGVDTFVGHDRREKGKKMRLRSRMKGDLEIRVKREG